MDRFAREQSRDLLRQKTIAPQQALSARGPMVCDLDAMSEDNLAGQIRDLHRGFGFA